MVTLCWAAKGGSGTTVVAAILALTSSHPSLLVDLDGELPTVLGLPEPDRPGVAEWLTSDSSPDQLPDLLVELGPHARLLPWRSGAQWSNTSTGDEPTATRWRELGTWMSDWARRWGCDVIIDAGTGEPPPELNDQVDRSLLVTRPCYLSLRRAVRCATRPSGVIVVTEPGRALSQRDIEHALGVPVEATVSFDPVVARAVDAGLLTTRLPRIASRELRRAAA